MHCNYELKFNFLESAEALINNSKYNEALQILKVIIIQEKTAKKIFPMIQKAECEIESGRKSKAENTSKEIASLMSSEEFVNETVDTKAKCHYKLKPLYNKLIENENFDTALKLIRHQLDLIKQSFESEEKLDKLSDLVKPLCDIAYSFNFQENAEQVKELYLLLDSILHDMQVIKDVDFETKTCLIFWFMQYYGTSCYQMKDFEKSLRINSNIIFFMKSNLGNAAENYLMYGYCQSNMADTLFELNRWNEAKQVYEQALSTYEQVQDWDDDEQKLQAVLEISLMLQKINDKLKT